MNQLQKNAPRAISFDLYQSVADIISLQGAHVAMPKIVALMKKYPEDSNVWLLQGVAQKTCGQNNEAIESFSKSISLNPANAEPLYQLGLIMQTVGHEAQAVELWESTIRHNPKHLFALKQLREIYLRDNNKQQLISTVIKLIKAEPLQQPAWEWLRQIIEQIPSLRLSADFIKFTEEYVRNLSRTETGVTAVGAYFSLLDDSTYPQWGSIFGHPANTVPEYPLPTALTLLQGSILQPLLARGIVSLRDFENYVCMFRSTLLRAWKEKTLPTTLPLEAIQNLAIYFFRIEFLPAVSAEETAWLEELKSSLQSHSNPSEHAIAELLIYACYEPFPTLANVAQWHSHYSAHPALQKILRNTYEDYLTEQEIRATLPRLSDIVDGTSNAVREQYEENPYPRWDHLPQINTMRVMDCIHQHTLMNPSAVLKIKNDPQILIAGCGTGMQTLMVTSRFPRAKILNVDLSSASIAYAARKAKELNLDKNLEFMQADILDLGKLNRQFDIVESIGVLHHMQNPMAGWKVLTNLLRPGGAMRIGLYSKIARKDIIAAREEIAERGLKDSIEDIRRFRAECLARKKNDFLTTTDFYTTSSVRDLLFHRSEQQFTIPQLQSSLHELGLEFLGFTQNGILHDYFNTMFPNEISYSNLSLWEELEKKKPSLFVGMYQFWCYKPR